MAQDEIGKLPDGSSAFVGSAAPAPATTPTVPLTTQPDSSSSAPPAPTLTDDPVAAYYNNLRGYDAGTDDASIKEKIRKEQQAYLDAIDARYVSSFAAENKRGENRLGQTRAGNARSGTLGSDFGNEATATTEELNKEQISALEAQKAAEKAAVFGKINELAQNEINARKLEAQNKFEGLQKLQADARGLIPQVAASGHDLTPEQRKGLVRQTGYDPLLFDAIYNNAKDKANQADYTYHNLGDGRVLRTGKTANGKAVEEKIFNYDMPKDSQLVIGPDGTPILYNKSDGTVQIAPGFEKGQFAKLEDTKIVKINGVDYLQNSDGSYSNPNVPEAKQQATELKTKALEAAQSILQEFKDNKGSAAVGASRIFGLQYLPGSSTKGFQVKLDNLKSLLSLDNVKYLKGQGQVSDAERRLLEQASSMLDPGLSEGDFQKALESVVKALSGPGDSSSGLGGQIIEYNGKHYQTDQDGNFDPNSPLTNAGSDANNAQNSMGMRTDRHNNPTAFTTDIAKMAGLKEGVDYTTGDTFSNGKYATAKLLQDPIATTIKVIDNIGFYTASGKPRWTYLDQIPQVKNWNNLDYNQKKNVIAQMYKHEGGSALTKYFT